MSTIFTHCLTRFRWTDKRTSVPHINWFEMISHMSVFCGSRKQSWEFRIEVFPGSFQNFPIEFNICSGFCFSDILEALASFDYFSLGFFLYFGIIIILKNDPAKRKSYDLMLVPARNSFYYRPVGYVPYFFFKYRIEIRSPSNCKPLFTLLSERDETSVEQKSQLLLRIVP